MAKLRLREAAEQPSEGKLPRHLGFTSASPLPPPWAARQCCSGGDWCTDELLSCPGLMLCGLSSLGVLGPLSWLQAAISIFGGFSKMCALVVNSAVHGVTESLYFSGSGVTLC